MSDRTSSGFRRIPTILLVDDHYAALTNLQRALALQGYKLLTATGGAAALDAIASVSIDLVVLDVVMPGIDGIEVAERLRGNLDTRWIPIVFCTGLPESVRRRFPDDAGSELQILSKPVEAIALRQAVARGLACRPTADRAAR